MTPAQLSNAIRQALGPLEADVKELRREVALLRSMMPDRLISVSELEGMVKEGRRTIYRRVQERRLVPVPRQGGTYFLPEEVQRAIDEGVLHRTGGTLPGPR